MKERRKRNMSGTGLLFLFCLLMLCGCAQITGFMENTEVSGREVESLAAEKEDDTVLLGGMPVGIYMETDGVLVLDTEKMTGMDGKEYTPAQGVVSSGDYITEVNHQKIEGKKQLMDLVEHLDGEKVLLTVRRENTILEKKLTPVQISKGNYRLGIWVRDNVQGLGTITFLTKNNRFAALGHGIHDIDTSTLLTIDRFEHTIGVMYTAASLAMRYHEDIDDAMMAGLLHDCGKYGSAQEQVERCQKHGILLTQSELEMPALVHAKLGAYFAEKEYGVTNKGVLSAITWHTTGRPKMTMLEKIIYIADYIEPNRKIIPGLQEIRETVFVDIDHAICLCAGNTVNYLRKNGKPVDPMSIETYQYYSDKGE